MPDLVHLAFFNIVAAGEHVRNARFSGLSLRGALPKLAKVELSAQCSEVSKGLQLRQVLPL